MTEASTNLFHNTVKEHQTRSSKFDIKIYAYFVAYTGYLTKLLDIFVFISNSD